MEVLLLRERKVNKMAWVLVILLSAAIFGITYYVQSTKKKELISEGKMIERKSSFYEESELFTTSASYEDMLKAVSQQVCPTVVSMVYDVAERTVYWCENRNWEQIEVCIL